MSFASKIPDKSPPEPPTGLILSRRIQNFPPDGLCSSMSRNSCLTPSFSFLTINSSMGKCSMSVVALKDEHRSWSGKIIFSDDEGSIIDHIGETVEAVLEVLLWVPVQASFNLMSHRTLLGFAGM